MWETCREIVGDALDEDAVDLEDISELRIVERGSERSLLNLKEKEDLLELNLDALGGEDRQSLIDGIVDTFESQYRLFEGEPNRVRKATSAALSDDAIQDAVDFFDNYLSGPDLTLIERSLSINQAWEVRRFGRDAMDDYKHDIAVDYTEKTAGTEHDDAYTAIHMAGSGYFDEGGYAREVFSEVEENYSDKVVDYGSVFHDIISESPFLVTVGQKSDVSNTVGDIEKRIKENDGYRFSVEFVDARAQGGYNRSILEEAVLEFQREVDTVNYDCTVMLGETVYRIFPGSVTGI